MTGKTLYRQKSGAYSTSKDYAHLKELLDKGLYVVAFINYDTGTKKYFFQDVCLASKRIGSYEFNSRGICYLSIDPELDYPFAEICEANGVEYIEPNKLIK